MKTCPQCDGYKKITCGECRGSGRHGSDPNKSCWRCEGTGKQDCYECGGTGKVDD